MLWMFTLFLCTVTLACLSPSVGRRWGEQHRKQRGEKKALLRGFVQIKACPLLLRRRKIKKCFSEEETFYDPSTTGDLHVSPELMDESKRERGGGTGCGKFVSYSIATSASEHQGASCLSDTESEFEEELKGRLHQRTPDLRTRGGCGGAAPSQPPFFLCAGCDVDSIFIKLMFSFRANCACVACCVLMVCQAVICECLS